MRRKANIMIFTLAAVIFFGSCVVDYGEYGEPTYLRCRAVMSKSTRADDVSEIFPITQDFSLWAYSLPRGKSWKHHSEEALPLLISKRFVGNAADNLWYCSDGQLVEWPLTKAITFFASTPVEAGGTYCPERGVCFDDYDAKINNYDLMYTDVVEDQVRENSALGVSIPFSRALCKVDVRAKTLLNTVTCTVYKVTIKQLHYKGSFSSLSSPQWTTTDDLTDHVIYQSMTGTELKALSTNTLYGAVGLFLPQKTAVVMEIEYTEKDSASGVITRKIGTTPPITDTWYAGKYYTYTLNFKADGVSFEEIKRE